MDKKEPLIFHADEMIHVADALFDACKQRMKGLTTKYTAGDKGVALAKLESRAIHIDALASGALLFFCDKIRRSELAGEGRSETPRILLEFNSFLNGEDVSPEDRALFVQAVNEANQWYNDEILAVAKSGDHAVRSFGRKQKGKSALPEDVLLAGDMNRRQAMKTISSAGLAMMLGGAVGGGKLAEKIERDTPSRPTPEYDYADDQFKYFSMFTGALAGAYLSLWSDHVMGKAIVETPPDLNRDDHLAMGRRLMSLITEPSKAVNQR